jgi:hypothetical protein
MRDEGVATPGGCDLFFWSRDALVAPRRGRSSGGAARLANRFRLDPNAAVVRPGDAGTLSGWEGGCATRASRPQGDAICSSGAATPSSRIAGVARAEARRALQTVCAWIQTPQWSAPETRVRSPVGRGDARRGRRDPRGMRFVLLEPRRPRRASPGSLERRRGAPCKPFALGSKRRSGPPRRRGYALRLGGGMRDEGVATPGGCDLFFWSRDALVAPRRGRSSGGAARLANRFRLDPNAAVVRPGDAGTLSGWEGGCATRASRPQGDAICSSGAATPSSRLTGVARAEARRASHPVFAWIQTPQWSAPETRVRSPVGRGDARRGRRDPRGMRFVLLEPRRPRRASLGSLERRRGAPRTPFSLGSKRRSGPPRRRGYALRLGGGMRDEGVATPGGAICSSGAATPSSRLAGVARAEAGRALVHGNASVWEARMARKRFARHRRGLRSRHRCGHESGTDGGARRAGAGPGATACSSPSHASVARI